MRNKRSIITIDADKCNGCGLCASACHEGAIGMVNGKAVLLSESYCDGLGACLPECPTGAIHLEEREADAFDQAAVDARMAAHAAGNAAGHEGGAAGNASGNAAGHAAGNVAGHAAGNAAGNAAPHSASPGAAQANPAPLACGCPGTAARALQRDAQKKTPVRSVEATADAGAEAQSELRQWPVQIQLVNPAAPYLQDARLLIAADCTAYACANFHSRFIRDHITLIGCPKLDDAQYADKLSEILSRNEIRSITVVRMEVPCCGGIVHAVREAMRRTGTIVPYREVTVTTDGETIEA